MNKGVFQLKIEESSKQLIREAVKTRYELEYLDHITIMWGVDKSFLPSNYIGQKVKVKCVKELFDENIQCLQVVVSFGLVALHDFSHITISSRKGVFPVESNRLFITKCEGVNIEGIEIDTVLEFIEFSRW